MKSSSSDLFSRFGALAKPKLVVLGSSASFTSNLMNRVGSLNQVEHVSPASLLRQEISRRLPEGSVARQEVILAALRRWFWTRKPDAGFVLTDFPATLLQALVFDEWLEARDEQLDAVLVAQATTSTTAVVEHYRQLGLLVGDLAVAA